MWNSAGRRIGSESACSARSRAGPSVEQREDEELRRALLELAVERALVDVCHRQIVYKQTSDRKRPPAPRMEEIGPAARRAVSPAATSRLDREPWSGEPPNAGSASSTVPSSQQGLGELVCPVSARRIDGDEVPPEATLEATVRLEGSALRRVLDGPRQQPLAVPELTHARVREARERAGAGLAPIGGRDWLPDVVDDSG